MSDPELTKEEAILRQVRRTLTRVIKDTATAPGMVHPLNEETIAELRRCLLLISEREVELNGAAGRSMEMRPRFADERRPGDEVVVHLDTSSLRRKPDPSPDSPED
ncbi:MAG: segregation and condensation protein A [Gammaproteobacteria bacterium]|nr:segregation and condensation protein A [Gammaproteobacteria bacterium]NIR28567.1 segregation and condensation protein A [Gammaproteobacteria bacterium]NIR97037.1 segregation and condensation protein A [Gammaproteobacteria bacterium]NIT62735.1 segregation and condensation protein A [Gammaproteobacteria bacterium]NIV19693.1 segregation and condensation protein A [Gammaproteobacteria bacterium]